MLKLRKLLLCDILYVFLVLIAFLIVLINNKTNIKKYTNIFTIKNYKIYEDKVSIIFKEGVLATYYFKNENEKNHFINDFSLGDKLRVNTSITTPSNNTIWGLFNYKKHLLNKGIFYICKLNSFHLYKKNNNVLLKIKNYIYKRIYYIKSNNYLYAFILGDTSKISDNIMNNYRINSVTHLFALSGLHVTLFSSLLFNLFKKLKISEKLSFILCSIFLLFFSYIVSFTPSILRATIFFILSNINKTYYFYIKPKNILYLTFFIMIIINKNSLFDNGFILSFIITFFIILYNEKNNKSSILIISILSFFSSLPIVINMSYEVNIIGFINNLLFIPYVSNIIFPLSLLTVVVPKLSSILKVLTLLMEYISSISASIVKITIYFQKISSIEVIIYYILLTLIIKNKKYIKILFCILLLFFYFKPNLSKNNRIYFLDVNQGDSTLITIKGKSILIDTGGNIKNSISEKILLFIKSIGLKKINYLILTHGDYDHMGEAINLVNNFKVEKVIFNCGEFNDLEHDLIRVLDKKKISYYSCIKELNIDNNKLFFLQTKEYDNENDNSNVIYTEINGYKFMFMGDAGVEKEKDILKEYNISDIDVLKVGHHGSKTSSSENFIDEANPKYSIISVGKNNRYGHPNKKVLYILEHSKIYRTDKDGSIMFKIKNNKLQVKTCAP